MLFGTDFGAGSMTTSGYPRVVKLWKRGHADGRRHARSLRRRSPTSGRRRRCFIGPQGSIALIERTVTFFTSEYQLLQPDGSLRALPVPLGADLKGVLDRRLLFTLARGLDARLAQRRSPRDRSSPTSSGPTARRRRARDVSVLFTPDAKSSIDEVVVGRDAVFASIYRDVTGSVHAFRPTRRGPLERYGVAACPRAVRRTSCRPTPLGRRHCCASRVSPPRPRSTSTPVTASRSRSSRCRARFDASQPGHGAVLRDLQGRHPRAVLRHAREGRQRDRRRPCCTATVASRSP